jgi:hypothetical protein
LQSPCKFKPHNIITLINPTREKIIEAMEALKEKAYQQGKKIPTTIFSYYSGHGTSLEGKLHISMPTVLT